MRVKLGESAAAKQILNQAVVIDREQVVFMPGQRDEIQQLINATLT